MIPKILLNIILAMPLATCVWLASGALTKAPLLQALVIVAFISLIAAADIVRDELQ